MPCPILNSTNLANGITQFRVRAWRDDFHHELYLKLSQTAYLSSNFLTAPSVGCYRQQNYLGPSLWGDLVAELQCWKALRPHPSSRFLTGNANQLTSLLTTYKPLQTGLPYSPLPVTTTPNASLRDFFMAAAGLKPLATPSAVFPSKCCNFLLPWEFPIYDRAFVGQNSQTISKMKLALHTWHGLPQKWKTYFQTNLRRRISPYDLYWAYRNFILLAWDTLPKAVETQLICQLSKEISLATGQPVWPHYPFRTKIPELCLA